MKPRGSLIAVASGKGGVGKTWLAITLAHALAQADRRVLLFDADLGLANVDIQLGLMPARDLGHAVSGGLALHDLILHPPGLFDIIAGRSGSASLASLPPERLEGLLRQLAGLSDDYDHIVLDLGAGLGNGVRRIACSADTLLVVATDEPTSLTDAYAVLKLFAADAGRGGRDTARIVVNQAASAASGQRTYGALARACGQFLGHAPPLLGIVRRDERVKEAIRRQTPLLTHHPASPAAADVQALARCLTGALTARLTAE